MEIIIRSGHIPPRLPGTIRYRAAPDTRGARDQALRELVKAGMSEEAALEQITRLTAGDIWCG